ncbi:Oligopeptidase B [Saliniradius amylolyticus]|uniref:Oligopeptidase B n=1 Tax=Saliniradius amylolyticus TaxID=2183582 RepID=A0A2S2E4E4_9ALTE|nr:S9 family peptidase [Saliniradius amylolyticus]AWL12525.1 Oligopeptidase B [Saliniradius amylolyticus]
MRVLLMACLIGGLGFCQVLQANEPPVFGGQQGYDDSLEAIEPTPSAMKVGLAGEQKTDIARYIMAANEGVISAALSPSGERVAFLWAITGEPQVWQVPVGGGMPQRLTYGNGVSFFDWLDNQTLIYGADNDGNEQEGFYTISADGSKERRLIPAKSGDFRRYGGVTASGDTIAYASTARTGSDFDIYLADRSTGQATRIVDGVFGYSVDSISPNGRYLVITEDVGEDGSNLYLFDRQEDEFTELSKPKRRAYHADSVWLDDNSGFYFLSSKDREFKNVFFYDVNTTALTAVVEEDVSIETLALCGEQQQQLVWTENHAGFSQLKGRNLKSKKPLDFKPLPEGVYRVQCPSGHMLVEVSGWQTPGTFMVWEEQTQRWLQPVPTSLAGVPRENLVKPESVTMPARDGTELQGLLYLPRNISASEKPPVVFFVHGGPTAQSRPVFDAVVQYHVNQGMAVFEPNVRGSTGFGFSYLSLDDRENRLDSIRDLVDMLQALGERGVVDANRAAVVGGSYGGYAVNAVLANYPGHFKAGASLFGVADWVTALTIASPGLRASDRIEYGDINKPEWKAFYEKNSPINQADNITVPVLYSHGVQDPRIDIAETEKMVRILRNNGVPAPYIRIPDEGHGWRKLKNQLFYYRYQAEFLKQQLREGAKQ